MSYNYLSRGKKNKAVSQIKQSKPVKRHCVTIESVELIGTSKLSICILSLDYYVTSIRTKKVISEQREIKSFSLIEITKEQLTEHRQNNIPSFVLKVDEKLYYTQIPKDLSLFSVNIFPYITHECSYLKKVCKFLSASPDSDGGCSKVRNFAKKIEKYDFIKLGFETFGTIEDTLYVGKCENCKQIASNE